MNETQSSGFFPPATVTTLGFLGWHDFECPKHGPYRKAEVGYLGSMDNDIDTECPVCRDERLHQEMLDRYRESEWLRRCESVGIPKRFQDYSLDGFRCDSEAQSAAVGLCREWVSGAVTNLMIFGPPGTGKTHLLCAALREAVIAKHTARFVTEDDMFRAVKETYDGKRSAMTESQILAYFGDIDYLAIDDMGRSRWSADESSILMKIINRRYNNRKSTAISTNLTPHNVETNGQVVLGLAEYLGEAITRRLEPGHRRIMATWPAYKEVDHGIR